MKRTFRLGLLLTAASTVLGLSSPAAAAVTVGTDITRTLSDRPTEEGKLTVSYADCMSEDQFTFFVDPGEFTGTETLEVWVGRVSDDCAIDDQRKMVTASNCGLLLSQAVDAEEREINLASRAIAEKVIGAAGCEDPDVNTEAKEIKIFFLLVQDAGDVPPENTGIFSTFVDLLGPNPPEDVTAGAGEQSLNVEFSQSEEEDTQGYNFYCALPSAGTTATTTGIGAGGSSNGGGGGAGGSDGGSGGEGGSGGSDTTTTGSDGTGGQANNCPSSALVPGDVPDPALLCGSIDKASGGPTGTLPSGEKLANGTLYTVAVAARDLVGNTGKLSEIACGTPQEVDDFFENYRGFGGTAGGGCSMDPSTSTHAFNLGSAGAALAALALLRRRRAPRRASAGRSSAPTAKEPR